MLLPFRMTVLTSSTMLFPLAAFDKKCATCRGLELLIHYSFDPSFFIVAFDLVHAEHLDFRFKLTKSTEVVA